MATLTSATECKDGGTEAKVDSDKENTIPNELKDKDKKGGPSNGCPQSGNVLITGQAAMDGNHGYGGGTQANVDPDKGNVSELENKIDEPSNGCAGEELTLTMDGACRQHGVSGTSDSVPMSPRQERMYFMQMANPESRAFNLGLCLHLKCKQPETNLPDNFPRLVSTAIKDLVKHHPNLRISVCNDNSQLGLVYRDPNNLDLCSVVDLPSTSSAQAVASTDAEGDREYRTSLEEQLSVFASKEIDLSKQPFHCALVTISPREVAIVFTFHHIIMDGTSLYIASRDLLKLLSGETLCPTITTACLTSTDTNKQNNSSNDEASRISEEGLKGAVDAKAKRKLDKWISLLSSARKCTSFPKHTIHGTHAHKSKHSYLPVPSTTHTSLTHLTSLTQVSSVVILSSMFACALAKFTSEADIIIGMVSANRGKDTTDVVSYFANTLPLRVDFSSEGSIKTLTDLLKHVKRNWSMILDGALDLADLLPHVDCLKHRGQSSILESPLQVLFSYYSVTEGNPLPVDVQVGGVDMTCQAHSPKAGHTHTDLVLEVDPTLCSSSGEQLFTCEYRVSALTQQQVERLHQLLCNFIEATYDAYTQSRACTPPLSLVTTAIGECLSTSNPGTSTPASTSALTGSSSAFSELTGPTIVNPDSLHPDGKPLCYIERFNKVVKEYPDSPAFVLPNRDTLTYKEVDLLVTKIALLLLSNGVQPGDHVAVHMSRRIWLYITILSVLRCGCAYVPIDANDTRERALKVLKLADVKLLVSESDLAGKFTDFGGGIVELNNTRYNLLLPGLHLRDADLVSKEFSDLKISYKPEQTAYILFTSGTTGEPKGVAITEANLHSTLDNLQHLFTPEETAMSLSSASVSFDGHITDALFPLINHSCLVVTDSILDVSQPDKTKENPVLEEITFAFGTPSAVSVVTFPKTMKALKVGGEVFSRACFNNTLHIPKVVNGYGPTECTAFVATNHLPRSHELDCPLSDDDIASIGLPVPNVKLLVLDEHRHLVPVGATGVLHIAGPTVSGIGYYGRPDLTQKAFFPNPLKSSTKLQTYEERNSPEPGKEGSSDIVYCTGDLVKILPNGKLQFLGRADDQVKLRGIRFHLLEVEHILSQCPCVTMSVTLVRNHGTSSAQLVACVTPASVDGEGVKAFVAKTLPKYMVPSVVVAFEEFPLTKTGKVDKKRLERLAESKVAASNEHSAGGKVSEHRVGYIGTPSNGHSASDVEVPESISQVADTPQVGLPSEDAVLSLALLLSEVYAKVLGVSKYDPHSDFFRSGGHSLLTFQLLREVNKKIGSTLNLSHVLQNTTPLQLARLVLSQRSDIQLGAHSNEAQKRMQGYVDSKERQKEVQITKEEARVIEPNQEAETTCHTEDVMKRSNASVQESSESAVQDTGHSQTFDYLRPVPDVAIPSTLQIQLEHLFKKLASHNQSQGSLLDTEDLAHKLELASGVHLPADSLAYYTSLGMLQSHFKLKTILDFKNQPNQDSVVVLHPRTQNESPLLFIHAGIIGWALPYYRLAQAMRVYSVAIQYSSAAPKLDFEKTARYYLDQIKSVQARGPYRLIGVCYGALLVYEIARQLLDSGECLQLAVLLNNSPCPENLPRVFTTEGAPLQGTTVHPYSFYQASLQLEFSQINSLKEFDQTGVKVEVLAPRVLAAYPWLPFSVQELVDAYNQYFLPIKAVWSGEYRPKPLNGGNHGNIVLVRNQHHPLFKSHDYGLLRLVDQEHLSVIVPNKDLGLLSDQDTLFTVASIIKLYIGECEHKRD